MLVVETVVRIRREHASGKAIKAIARDLRLSRKVVRKAIRAPEGAFDYHRTVQPLPRLGPFQERLDTLLTENEARHRRDRLRMTRIHDLLLREGFERGRQRAGPTWHLGAPETDLFDLDIHVRRRLRGAAGCRIPVIILAVRVRASVGSQACAGTSRREHDRERIGASH